MDITKTKRIPRNNFVLKIAKISKALDSLTEKICVNVIVIPKKMANNSSEKRFVDTAGRVEKFQSKFSRKR